MANVMIRCPVTGDAVPTGFWANFDFLKTNEVNDATFGPCSSCGGEHSWSNKDAFPDS